jgi:alanine racemase
MSYRTLNCIDIDLEALRHNFRVLRDHLASPSVRMLAIVKSDAYGHGLIPVSRTLVEAGVWGLGVSELEEAGCLREAGITCPILLLSGLAPGAEKDVYDLDLIAGVQDRAALDALERVGRSRDEVRPVHIKVDTGMGRLGFDPKELPELARCRGEWPHLRFVGLFSHLAAADVPGDPLNSEQLASFAAVQAAVRAAGWAPEVTHLVNSAGLIHFREAHYDLVRPGLALYGAYPGLQTRSMVGLRPVMTFRSQVIAVHQKPAGAPVSYGHMFVTERPSRIGVVPVGYDDGYLRSLSNRAHVSIRGQQCPVVGRVCMKALTVDVTDVRAVSPGDDVVLLGPQGDTCITIELLAEWAGTISYELLCLLGSRNQRHYQGA